MLLLIKGQSITPLNKMPRVFTEVEGIVCLSVSLKFIITFVPEQEKAHCFVLHQGKADLWRWRGCLSGPRGSRYRKKKAVELWVEEMTAVADEWLQREGKDRGHSAVTSEQKM